MCDKQTSCTEAQQSTADGIDGESTRGEEIIAPRGALFWSIDGRTYWVSPYVRDILERARKREVAE